MTDDRSSLVSPSASYLVTIINGSDDDAPAQAARILPFWQERDKARAAAVTRRCVFLRILRGPLSASTADLLERTESRAERQPPETHHVRRVHGKEQRGHVMRTMQAGSVADLVRFVSRLGIPPPGVPDPTKVGSGPTHPR